MVEESFPTVPRKAAAVSAMVVSLEPSKHKAQHCPDPICEEIPYIHIAPGEYEARCVRAEKYFDQRFKRWSCRLTFRLIHSDGEICCFLNLGEDRNKPRAGRSSKYRTAWVIANGDVPKRRQVLSDRVFKGKIFLVKVEDVKKRHDGRDHFPGDTYSVVREILQRVWG